MRSLAHSLGFASLNIKKRTHHKLGGVRRGGGLPLDDPSGGGRDKGGEEDRLDEHVERATEIEKEKKGREEKASEEAVHSSEKKETGAPRHDAHPPAPAASTSHPAGCWARQASP
jgi:hypothetical protein